MSDAAEFLLVFRPLAGQGTGYSFPCDGLGGVDLNRLEPDRRNDYFFARAMVGRATSAPQVIKSARTWVRADPDGPAKKELSP